MTRIRLSVAVLLLVTASAIAQTPGRTLIRAGHLLDVHTGKLLEAQTIVVTGGGLNNPRPLTAATWIAPLPSESAH